mmetsp:Transcript_11072/g.68172  ORF Transcript_11072/g.68172 Transcript_11072/m.68172 type:complete len:215 (+) Transcript_11072:1523-2167(+)
MEGSIGMNAVKKYLLLVEHEHSDGVFLRCQADTSMERQLHHCTGKHHLRAQRPVVCIHHHEPASSSHVSSSSIGRRGGQQDIFAAMQHQAEVCTQRLEPGAGHTASIFEAETLPEGVLLVAWIRSSTLHVEFVRTEVAHGASEAEQRLPVWRKPSWRLVWCVGNPHGTFRRKMCGHFPSLRHASARFFAAFAFAKQSQQSVRHGCDQRHTLMAK